MLNFSLDKLPPTSEEIAAEKDSFWRQQQPLLRRKRLLHWCVTGSAGIALAALIGFIMTSNVFAYTEDAVPIFILVTAVLYTGCLFVSYDIISALISTLVITCLGVFGITYHIVYFSSSIAATLITSIVALVLSRIFFIRADNALDDITGFVKSLSYIDNDYGRHRCPQILEFCKANADCEDYRLAVVQQGRALTCAEASMMEDWAKGAEARKERENALHLQQVACVMLKSPESV